MKNIKDNNKSKARIFGTILIAVLVIATSFTVLFLIPQSPLSMKPASAAVVGDYSYSKQITIDHTKVNSILTNFPVWAYNISSDYADNILANGADIAFFDSTKTTRFNHEIETWVKGTGELGVWVNITSVSSSVDTVFYIYYGDSDTADSRNHNPTDVWDNNFLAVYHMNSSSGNIYDSTSNKEYGTASGNPTYEQTGICGYAIDLDGTGDYYDIDSLVADLAATSTGTVSAWCEQGGWFQSDTVFCLDDNNPGTSNTFIKQYVYNDTNIYQSKTLGKNADTPFLDFGYVRPTDNPWAYGTWYYFSWRQNGTHYANLLNGEEMNSSVDSDWWDTTTNPDSVVLGASEDAGSGINNEFTGKLDEIRISKVGRNDSWINVSYTTMYSPSTFLTFGSQSSDDSVCSLKGLTNDRITFSGTAGTSIYCNSSGTNNEWPEINMSINASTNYTELRVWIGDFNDTSAYINATNITAYVSSDNSSYGQLGTFPDGGGNCTYAINATNWNAGTMGADPFAGAGLTNKTVSIWVIFKIAVPSNTPTDEFWSGTIDSFKIHLGHHS